MPRTRFVHLLLLTSERAWAHAMYMKSSHSADATSKGITGSTKSHIVSRLNKACGYAGRLVEVLKNRDVSMATIEAVLEARAYYLSLRGAIEFEKQAWEYCLHAYSEAWVTYTSLAQSQGLKKEDLFRDLLSTTIDPSIRYAAYQLKLPRTTSIDTIVIRYIPREKNEYLEEILKRDPEALADPSTTQKKTPSGQAENVPKAIQWRSRTVNIEDAATAQALAAVSTAEKSLSTFLSSNSSTPPQTRAAAYDEVLVPSQDAVDATKTALDELSAEGIPQSDRRMQSLQITRTAVNYALIGWRIGRNRILCGPQDGALLLPLPLKKSKPSKKYKSTSSQSDPLKSSEESTPHLLKRLRERVVLYDATLQSLDSISDLPGVAADAAFLFILTSKRAYFSSLRCLAIARSHSLLQAPKTALALLARGMEHLSSIASSALDNPETEAKPPNLHISPGQLSALKSLLETLLLHHRALVTLHNLSSSNAAHKRTDPPLVERLDTYPSTPIDLKNLVTYPPKVEPIPVKPLFLDVAWNYIDYPGRNRNPGEGVNGTGAEEEAERVGKGRDGKKEERGGKGWFGFGR